MPDFESYGHDPEQERQAQERRDESNAIEKAAAKERADRAKEHAKDFRDGGRRRR